MLAVAAVLTFMTAAVAPSTAMPPPNERSLADETRPAPNDDEDDEDVRDDDKDVSDDDKDVGDDEGDDGDE